MEFTPDPEHIARLLGSLGQLAAGMRAIGTPEVELWRLLLAVSLGGVHPVRRSILDVLVTEECEHATSSIAGRIRLPDTTTRRRLQELVSLHVLDPVGSAPERWRASDCLRDPWRVTSRL